MPQIITFNLKQNQIRIKNAHSIRTDLNGSPVAPRPPTHNKTPSKQKYRHSIDSNIIIE